MHYFAPYVLFLMLYENGWSSILIFMLDRLTFEFYSYIVTKMRIIINQLSLGGFQMSRMHTEDLHIHYGNNKVINGIDIKIPDKQVTAIIGSNGCGKSTLLKAMTRIIPYQDGTVIFDGKEIS